MGAVIGTARRGRAVTHELIRVDVRLAQQHRVTGVPLHVLTPVVQDGEVERAGIVVGGDLFEHERCGVDAEAGRSELEPERHHFLDLGADLGVGPVQVWLEVVEAVEVPAPGFVVEGPRLTLLAREDDALTAIGRLGVAPHVPVAKRRVGVTARGSKPGVLIGGVVHHKVEKQPDTAFAGLDGQLGEVAERSQPGIDAVVVADVIAVVALRRGVDRIEPQAGDPQPREVVQTTRQPRQVATPVTVGVLEQVDLDAVDNCFLVPAFGRHPAPSLVAPARHPRRGPTAAGTSTTYRRRASPYPSPSALDGLIALGNGTRTFPCHVRASAVTYGTQSGGTAC